MGDVKIKVELEESKDNLDLTNAKESYEEKLKVVNTIATPMAPKKLTKKIYKCIKKGNIEYFFEIVSKNNLNNRIYLLTASKQKGYLRNGLKDVQKHIRKGETGYVINKLL